MWHHTDRQNRSFHRQIPPVPSFLEARVYHTNHRSPSVAHFMSGKRIEIAIHILNVHWDMRSTLGSVNEENGAVVMSDVGNILDWNNGAENIRYMGNGYHFCGGRHGHLYIGKRKCSIGLHWNVLPFTTGCFRDPLPRADTPMMLHCSEDNVIPSRYVLSSITMCNHVDRCRCTTGEDNFCRTVSIYKAPHFFTSIFILIRCPAS